jgi:fido (protein-threonine AMPylation protein)
MLYFHLFALHRAIHQMIFQPLGHCQNKYIYIYLCLVEEIEQFQNPSILALVSQATVVG